MKDIKYYSREIATAITKEFSDDQWHSLIDALYTVAKLEHVSSDPDKVENFVLAKVGVLFRTNYGIVNKLPTMTELTGIVMKFIGADTQYIFKVTPKDLLSNTNAYFAYMYRPNNEDIKGTLHLELRDYLLNFVCLGIYTKLKMEENHDSLFTPAVRGVLKSTEGCSE